MSRSLILVPFALAFFVGCGDPYVAPRSDGGPSDGDGAVTDDVGTLPGDGATTDTDAPREDVGSAGDPCTSSGKAETGACGNCGSRVRVCGSDLKWSEWSACSGEGVCSPGATDSTSCGTGGTRTRTCSSACTWGSYGTCVGGAPPCGSLGAVDTQACGKCGTQGRVCESTGWGPWGACTGEGVCTPGATDSASCGTGGTMTRTCGGSCTWGAYGSCVGGIPTTGCAGTLRQTFSSSATAGMWGCSGKVAWSSANTLCAAGMHVCTAAEFQARRAAIVPDHHYWVSDYLNGSGTASGNCKASLSTASGNFCPAAAPMRVCASGLTDVSGNYCTWVGCGYESNSGYWGGCNDQASTGNGLRAGALCCN